MILRVSLCGYLILTSFSYAYSQNEFLSTKDFLEGYELVYGNEKYRIISFEHYLKGFIVLSRGEKSGVSEIFILDDEYLVSDSMNIESWPSNETWLIDNAFFYRPTLLYENTFCDEDGRYSNHEIIVKMLLEGYKISNTECLVSDARSGNKSDVNENGAYTVVQQEKRNKMSVEVFVVDKTVFRRVVVTKDIAVNSPFLIERLPHGFVIFSILTNEIILIKSTIEVISLNDFSKLPIKDYQYQLKYDKGMNSINIIQINKNEEYMSLYTLNNNELKKATDDFKKSYYNKVQNGTLYSVFHLKNEEGDFNGIFSKKINF